MKGLVVDNFAGGGGASLGIEQAIGRPIDLAVNHSATALAMHAANHPATIHRCESVWSVDPVEACSGRPVALAWFSPDCRHFSKAKGSAPRSKGTRSLAWVVTRWAKAVRPRIIMLENVEEFSTWGPLTKEGLPDPKHAGRTFRAWLSKLRGYGYKIEWRILCAADFGAPTTRRRLFLAARSDGQRIEQARSLAPKTLRIVSVAAKSAATNERKRSAKQSSERGSRGGKSAKSAGPHASRMRLQQRS